MRKWEEKAVETYKNVGATLKKVAEMAKNVVVLWIYLLSRTNCIETISFTTLIQMTQTTTNFIFCMSRYYSFYWYIEIERDHPSLHLKKRSLHLC